MPFNNEVKNRVLLWSDRHCCLCKKACGANIEVHHIVPEQDNGSNDIDNAIPLCFDCHGHVHQYSERHPVGTKYKTEELRNRREQVYEEFTRHLIPPIHYEITQNIPGTKARRAFPDVGFVLQHLGAALPVCAKVKAELRADGSSLGSPSGPHYSGAAVWHINPQVSVNGHFTFSRGHAGKIAVIITVTIIDQYDREHVNLPVAWIYMREANQWYFEPCITEV